MKKMRFCLLVFLMCLSIVGCGQADEKEKAIDEKPQEVERYGIDMQPCIYYDGKVYWFSDIVEDIADATYLAEVKLTEDKNVLPYHDFYISSTGDLLKDHKIYHDNKGLYVKYDEYYYYFNYNDDHKQNGKDITYEEIEQPDEDSVGGEYPPHFVYDNVVYSVEGILRDLNEEDLKTFKKVGETKRKVWKANENYSANFDVGSELYKSNLQNNYMLVRYTNGKYEYYKNTTYWTYDYNWVLLFDEEMVEKGSIEEFKEYVQQ